VDHRNSGSPWTGLHCRQVELTGARPTAALGSRLMAKGKGGGVEHEGLDGPLTRGRAAVRRPDDDGEDVAVEALGACGAWAQREESKSRERCGGER
jgi:hypothetical protein